MPRLRTTGGQTGAADGDCCFMLSHAVYCVLCRSWCHAFHFFSFSPFCFAIGTIGFLLIRYSYFSSKRRQKSRLSFSIARCLVLHHLGLEPWALSHLALGYRLGATRNGKVDKRKAPHRSLRPRSSRVGCEVHGASTASTEEAEVAASRGANFTICWAKAAKT